MSDVDAQRIVIRQELIQELEKLGVNTAEARRAIDLAMDVAAAFSSDNPLYEISKRWNRWTFDEAAAVFNQEKEE